jgi:thioredoxin
MIIRAIRLSVLVGFITCLTGRVFAQEVITITDQNFEEEVIHAREPVLVHFYAQWAGPSRKLAPIIEQVSRDYRGRLKVGKLNVDDNTKIPKQYNVQSIPTLILWTNGRERERLTGAISLEALNQKLAKYVRRR